MRIATKQTDIYTFADLDESTQSTVIDNLRDINTFGSFWYECVFGDAKEIANIIGIEIRDIYFSGFSSQGDGACFEGEYKYRKGAHKAIREYAPLDDDLHSIADRLRDLQRRNFYGLSASVKHSGHYSHAYCTEIKVYKDTGDYYRDYADCDTDEQLCEILRDLMNWIYARLESEYWYLTSDNAVRESIEANEYEFTINGEVY